MKKWNEDKIIKEVKKLRDKSDRYNRKNNRPLYRAGCRYFGSWRKAIERAGYNYNDVRRNQGWTKSRVLKEIKYSNNKTCDYNQKNNHPLYRAGCRYFGSWKKAIEAAGYNYNDVRKNKKWTKSAVLKKIKQLRIKSYIYTAENNPDLLGAGCYYFGSWARAVKAAGFDYVKIKKLYKFENEVGQILKLVLPNDKIKEQKTFPWLKFKNNMYLDRWIPRIRTAIEINGEQHYRPRKLFGGEKKFKYQQARDRKKAKLLREHKIRLIVIPYTTKLTEENIRRILIENGVKL